MLLFLIMLNGLSVIIEQYWLVITEIFNIEKDIENQYNAMSKKLYNWFADEIVS